MPSDQTAESLTSASKMVSQEEDIVLYHGSSSRNGVRHLARPGDEQSLCNRVELEYANGGLDGNKTSPFKDFESSLGGVCHHCKRKYRKEEAGKE